MVRRSRAEDESVAVLEEPAKPVRSAAEIAAAASEQTLRLRLESCANNIRRWREIVADVTAGQEPDGARLAEIARIADELRLPPDALAVCVGTITREQSLVRQVEESEQRAEAAIARSPALAEELEATRVKLLELEREVVAARSSQIAWADNTSVLSDHRQRHPLMYAEPDRVADLVLKSLASNGMGTSRWEAAR
jgi:hypothetical protein